MPEIYKYTRDQITYDSIAGIQARNMTVHSTDITIHRKGMLQLLAWTVYLGKKIWRAGVPNHQKLFFISQPESRPLSKGA